MNQKGFSPLFIVLGIILVIGIVGGVYFWGTRKTSTPVPSTTPAPEVTSQISQSTAIPQNTPIPSPTPAETANWKTYTNTKYGYTIKYPISWYVSQITNGSIETADLVYIYSKSNYNGEGGGVRIVVDEGNTQRFTAKEYKNNQIAALVPSIQKGIQITEFKINGINAVQVTGEPDPGNGVIDTFLVNNTKDYSILLALPANEEDKTIYNQILSTFRFD